MENKISRHLVHFFAVWFCWIIFLPLFFIFIFKQPSASLIFWEALVASAIARLLFVEPLKIFFNLPRPYEVGSAVKLMGDPYGSSFPSGHAAFFSALAASSFLHDLKWGTLFLLGALIIVVARVLAGVHWKSDVVIGMIIGAATSFAVHLFF